MPTSDVQIPLQETGAYRLRNTEKLLTRAAGHQGQLLFTAVILE